MEKDQVTFAVQGHEIKGPVGKPILIVCEALRSSPQSFVIFRQSRGVMMERQRCYVEEGPLSAHAVEFITAQIDAEIYTALSYFKGVQAEFEILP